MQHGVAFSDGSALTIHKDIDKSCASIARFSRRDAETYRAMHQAYALEMQPLFAALMYNPPLASEAMRDRLSGPQAKELFSFARHDIYTAIDKSFEDLRLRALFKVLYHATAGENEPGTGLALPLMLGSLTDIVQPCGGSVSLPLALARVVEAGGGTVRTQAEVREICVAGGRASGVKLADGTRIEAGKFVASSLNLPATMRLSGEEHFPQAVRDKMEAWNWGTHTLVTLHLALSDKPDYAAAQLDADMNRAFNVIFGAEDGAQRKKLCPDQAGRNSRQPDGQRHLPFAIRSELCAGRQARRLLVSVCALCARRRRRRLGPPPRRIRGAHPRALAGLRAESRRQQCAGAISLLAA